MAAADSIDAGRLGIVLGRPRMPTWTDALMAKIRSLKGEFFRNAGVSRGGLVAKTLAAGLICAVADDDGRFKVKVDDFKGEIFTHDPVSVADIDKALQSLVSEDFVRVYHDHGRAFGAVVNWKSHQPVPPSRYIASVLPAPPNTKQRRHSPTERKHSKDSASSRAGVGSEGIGRDRKGRDISPTAHSADAETALVLQSEISVSPAVQVFRAWVTSTGRSGRTVLDDKRQRLIVRALAAYELEDVLDAVDGWRFDAHHRGENDRGRPYNDLGLILRDPEHIERFRDFKRRPIGLVMPTGKPSMGDFYRDQAAKHAEAGD